MDHSKIAPSELIEALNSPDLTAEDKEHIEALIAENLAEMAIDPDIQRELALIEQEFADTEQDGLSEE